MLSNHINEGERLLQLGRYEEALACFNALLDQDPDARFGSAVALQLLGRFEEAEQQYQRVLAIFPRDEEVLSNLIAMSVEQFDLDRVERYSRRLLQINADHTVALEGLTLTAVERRDYPTAAQYLSRIVWSEEPPGDAIEYRLSPALADRLRSLYGTIANSH